MGQFSGIVIDEEPDVVSEIVSLFTEAFGAPPQRGLCVWEQYPDLEPEYEPCVICVSINGGLCPTTGLAQAIARRHHAHI